VVEVWELCGGHQSDEVEARLFEPRSGLLASAARGATVALWEVYPP
jgi:hypothetical protein